MTGVWPTNQNLTLPMAKVGYMYAQEDMHTASLGRRDGLISAQVTTSSPRLKARAGGGDEC